MPNQNYFCMKNSIMRHFSNKLIIIILALSFTHPDFIFAQKDAKDNLSYHLEGLKYRLIGPHRGGRVTTVTGVQNKLFTFYMGATGGGVWKTTDGGLSWDNISDGDFKVGSIGAIAVAPSDANVIYVGTGAADLRGNVSPGCGIYKSLDGGESWAFTGLEKAGQIAKIVIHPDNPDHLYVAVLGNAFGPSKERGIYESTDGGQKWKQQLFVSDKTGAVELIMDPQNPRILYAGMWTAERKPWTMIDGSEEGGVWKSKDGGDNWNKLEGGLPDGLVGRVGIAVSPVNSKRVWVFQEAKEESKGGLYRSDDGGVSFKRINREHHLRQRAWYYSRIYADPQDENTVYFLNVGFYRSIDGGKNFDRVRTPHSDNHALWINPDNPQVMIEGNDGGACVTFNGGNTWTTQNNQPTAEFYRVTVDNQHPYRVYGAQQDNSTMSVPSRNQDALNPEQNWRAVGGGESGHIAVDPRDPNLIYAGTYIGQITRKRMDLGHQRDIVAYPQMHDGQAPRDIKYRFQWNAPIRISPHNADIVYHCSQYVHRTMDGGKTWEVISPDLTTNKDAYQDIPGGPIQHDHTGVELYTTIFAFEESPHQAGELWAGSDDGLIHISRDNGSNWEDITPVMMPAEGTVNTIDLSAHSPGRAIVSVYKYRENDFHPYVFLTNNYGKDWTLLTDGKNGIPENHFVRVVREDPNRRGLLYAGTEFGMYISFDEGKQWQAFQLNLPIVPITDMLIKDRDLVIATQGRSFWILDDLSPLYSISQDILKETAHLFAPNAAYRSQLRNLRADNAPDPAPNGALIYFHVKEKPSSEEEISLSIIDPFGNARKTFSTQPKDDAEKLMVSKGLNRFSWNMKYEAPKVQDGAVFSLANTGGINAIPGEHQVVLKIGSKSYEQPLNIKIDPRWEQTEADLIAQYELTFKIKELLNECHYAIGQIRSLNKQLKNIEERAGETSAADKIKQETSTLSEKLTNLEDLLIQKKSESGQDPINYPSMLDDQIAYLYSVVNAQDDRPNEGAYQRFEDLEKALKVHTDHLKSLVKIELKALNEMLKKEGVEVVSASKAFFIE